MCNPPPPPSIISIIRQSTTTAIIRIGVLSLYLVQYINFPFLKGSQTKVEDEWFLFSSSFLFFSFSSSFLLLFLFFKETLKTNTLEN